MRGIALLLVGAAIVGCGNQKPTTAAVGDATGIVNGSEVVTANKYSKHTVFIQTRTDSGGGICTGSIYDSQTILTAAHCLVGARQALIVFAHDVRNASNIEESQVRVVKMAAVHPEFNPRALGNGRRDQPSPSLPEEAPVIPRIPTVEEVLMTFEANNIVLNDVAMLSFEGGLPEGYEAVKFASVETVAAPGATMHMIGYGLARVDSQMRVVNGKAKFVPVPDGATSGRLRETEVAISKYSAKTKLIMSVGTTTSVCSGDSGGPSFVTDASGQHLQVGIAEAVANEYCNSVSMHTSVVPYLAWIHETAAGMKEKAAERALMF